MMTTRTKKSGTSSRFQQGWYIPKNPHKYVGDIEKIRYMSSYELETHQFLDNNPNVLLWCSEEIVIPYVKPTDQKVHKYYPDYWVEYVTRHGEVRRMLIEVKPKSQTQAPRGNRKHALYEQVQWAINQSKWQAAINWCKHRTKLDTIPIDFKIITERSIFA